MGKAATPNILGRKGDGRPDSARAKVMAFKRNPNRNPSPIPLENCPWCQTRFEPESFTLLPDADGPRELRIVCPDFECEFSGDRPLPVVGVDEPIYRRLPAFLIATVDKFASLPWVGQAGAQLGGADRVDREGLYGAAEPGAGRRLVAPAPGAGSDHPGRTASDRGTTWHDGWSLRDGDRGAGGAPGGREDDQAEDRRLDGHRPAGAGSGSGAVRTAGDVSDSETTFSGRTLAAK